ncbi:MAG TPA: leucine--tRNA ligase [Actinomycetota bacterium]
MEDPREIERRWQARWQADRLYELDLSRTDPSAKFYNLVEFPYPSAEGLHVGHAYTYCGADTFGRFRRMQGRAVFQPIGFDSFGIHTENYALRSGEHPMRLTARTIQTYRGQLRRLGAAFDWSREVVTSDPSYYRWTQWVFLQLYRAGLAYRAEAPVVWCPSCLTVLAYEQLEGDRCERCATVVTGRVMKQWFLRITSYADRLLEGLGRLDWPEVAKRLQREWIGRRPGAEVSFEVPSLGETLTAFTTRIDTLFGVTFVAVSPSHPLATRVDGATAVHPATGAPLPIVVADYVMGSVGTGVVMGVPAHDERDHALAVDRGLPIVRVVDGGDLPWTGEGRLVASGRFTGMSSSDARAVVADWLAASGSGGPAVRYRLHDWLISRQRYWGPPIPIIHCLRCGEQPVPEDQLPIVLPELEEFRPTGTGAAPLAAAREFVETTCPSCGTPAERETDVSDTFFDSAWYFLRYPSSEFADRAWDPERTQRMLPVDQYAGGREHVARHHLYARLVTMALHDLGLVPFPEPFPRLRLHGFLLAEGRKMSKSRGNVVNPDVYVERVGADVLRTYLLFCGDWEQGGDFTDAGLRGIERFVGRAWRVLTAPVLAAAGGQADLRPLHRAVDSVSRDLERLKFNTAIARLMELVHWAEAERPRMSGPEWSEVARTSVLLLAPFAPHLAEELWERLGEQYSVHQQRWPEADPEALREWVITIVVQVNGRVRDRIQLPAGATEDQAVEAALSSEKVRRHLNMSTPRTGAYVPDRLLNLIV